MAQDRNPPSSRMWRGGPAESVDMADHGGSAGALPPVVPKKESTMKETVDYYNHMRMLSRMFTRFGRHTYFPVRV